jgi:hypothetical protein
MRKMNPLSGVSLSVSGLTLIAYHVLTNDHMGSAQHDKNPQQSSRFFHWIVTGQGERRSVIQLFAQNHRLHINLADREPSRATSTLICWPSAGIGTPPLWDPGPRVWIALECDI